VADVRFVLASGSPRRAELLERLGLSPEIRPAEVDESARPGERPAQLVARLAEAKAATAPVSDGEVVVAADTVVVLGERVLGKPASEREAARMLAELSGRTHHVLTGVHLRRGDRRAAAVEDTAVRFRSITAHEIAAYVATGEPLDKAGAYGIQGRGGMFVEWVSGSDSNVVGLPLATVVRLAGELGVEILPR
jgi:septum formation protein